MKPCNNAIRYPECRIAPRIGVACPVILSSTKKHPALLASQLNKACSILNKFRAFANSLLSLWHTVHIDNRTIMGLPQDISAKAVESTPTSFSDEESIQKSRPWYYYLWDTLDKPKEERWFMFKLDAALLTFASLGQLWHSFC